MGKILGKTSVKKLVNKCFLSTLVILLYYYTSVSTVVWYNSGCTLLGAL